MLLLPLSLVDVNRMSCSEQVYATSMAMLLTMVLSIYLFNFRPTLQVHTFYMLLISLQRYSLYITSNESSRIQINHVVVHLEWYTHFLLLHAVTMKHEFHWRCEYLIVWQLFLGILICCMSLQMYFAPPQSLVDLPTQPTTDTAEPHRT